MNSRPTLNNNFSIVQWNARSINPNKGSLEVLLYSLDIQVAVISETWLRKNYDFKINSYKAVRADRFDGRGGSMILVKNYLEFEEIKLNSPSPLIQICGARIKLPDNAKMSIISCYCSPGHTISTAEWIAIFENIESPVMFLGDYNSHALEWGCSYTDRQGEALVNLAEEVNLVILNDGTETRINYGSINPSIVDVSFCSASISAQFSYEVLEDSLGSDHFPILLRKTLSLNQWPVNFKPKFKTEVADWNCYKNIIINEFYNAPFTAEVLVRYDFLERSIMKAAEISIPQTKLYLGKKPPMCWWNRDCDEIIKNRKQAHYNYKNNPNLANYIELKRLQAKAKHIVKSAKRNSWEKFCSTINPKTSNKDIWRKVKKITGNYINNKQLSENIIDEFLDKLIPPNVPLESINYSEPPHGHIDVLSSPFSLYELERVVSLNKDTAPGIDRISYSMIKHLPLTALKYTLDIFNDIRYQHIIPASWKTQIIIPILKPGKSSSSGASYRPIALSSCILKIFEKLIKCRMEYWLENSFQLPLYSFGFRRESSTMDNLTVLVNSILESFAYKKITSAAFIDIEGAYDNINLHQLHKKLIELGIGHSTATLIFKLLYGRELQVYSDTGELSRIVHRGIPQGSILSPLLFICYTYDIDKYLPGDCRILQYADDLILYNSSLVYNTTVNVLSQTILSLNKYLNRNSLNISFAKSSVCVFTRRRIQCPEKVNLGGNDFQIKANVKYLGMVLDSKLRWQSHIIYLMKKCIPSLNTLQAVANFKWGAHPESLLTIYKSLIRSRLEYGNYLFGNAANCHLTKLDRIQYKGLRICLGYLRSTPTNAILIEANDPPLDMRTEFMAAKFFLKRKARFFHPTIESIASLEKAYDNSGFWNNTKIPHFVKTVKKFNNLNIKMEKFSLAPIHKVSQEIINTPTNIRLNEPYLREGEIFDHLIFTDGSKNHASVGCAFFNSSNSFFHLLKLPAPMSIYTAELIAIREALFYVKANNMKSINIISDSKSALMAISNIKKNKKITNLQIQIANLLETLSRNNQMVTLSWVKSHSGNPNNELVDYLAKKASTTGHLLNEGTPWRDVVSVFKKQLFVDWANAWSYSSQTKGSALASLKKVPGPSWFKYLPDLTRPEIIMINRLRINHSLCNYHRHRFALSDSPYCNCALVPATPEHLILFCPLYNNIPERKTILEKIEPKFRDPPNINSILKHPDEQIIKCIYQFTLKAGITF